MTIDAHHHFLDPTRNAYPWIDERRRAIDRTFDADDLAPLLSANEIDGTILVQTVHDPRETREMLAVATQRPWIAGVVGWIDLTRADVAEQLDAVADLPGGDRLVGIRHLVQDEADPGWLRRRDVLRGLRAVGDRGLAFDLLLQPRQLPAAIDAVRSLPTVDFVLDHLAKPPIREGWGAAEMQGWTAGLRALADSQNVACKLSGLVTEADWAHWHVDDLRPFVEHALDCFGTERMVFGSDWPVSVLAASYERVVEAAERLTAHCSSDERQAIFHENAVRLYSLTAYRQHAD